MAQHSNNKGGSRRDDCCSFCGRKRNEVEIMFQGLDPNVNICNSCIELGYKSLSDNNLLSADKAKSKSQFDVQLDKVPRPAEIKALLDEYVIGRESAKRYISVAV